MLFWPDATGPSCPRATHLSETLKATVGSRRSATDSCHALRQAPPTRAMASDRRHQPTPCLPARRLPIHAMASDKRCQLMPLLRPSAANTCDCEPDKPAFGAVAVGVVVVAVSLFSVQGVELARVKTTLLCAPSSAYSRKKPCRQKRSLRPSATSHAAECAASSPHGYVILMYQTRCVMCS